MARRGQRGDLVPASGRSPAGEPVPVGVLHDERSTQVLARGLPVPVRRHRPEGRRLGLGTSTPSGKPGAVIVERMTNNRWVAAARLLGSDRYGKISVRLGDPPEGTTAFRARLACGGNDLSRSRSRFRRRGPSPHHSGAVQCSLRARISTGLRGRARSVACTPAGGCVCPAPRQASCGRPAPPMARCPTHLLPATGFFVTLESRCSFVRLTVAGAAPQAAVATCGATPAPCNCGVRCPRVFFAVVLRGLGGLLLESAATVETSRTRRARDAVA